MGCIKAGDVKPPGMGSTTSTTVTSGGSTTTASSPISVRVCSTCNQVLVQVRPHSTYDGEFGFDWIRVGDTSMYGDALPYADFNVTPTAYNMLGKYYKDSRKLIPIRSINGWKVCTDTITGVETIVAHVAKCTSGTTSTNWQVSPSQYNSLTSTFKTMPIPPWKSTSDSNFKYYVPVLTLIPDENIDNGDGTFTVIQGNSAKLTVHIEVVIASSHIKLKPQRINTGVEFKVGGVISDNLTINAGIHDAHLEIRCTKPLLDNLDIDIYADDNLCGRFTILKNDSSVVVKKKILWVQVESDFNIASPQIGSPKSGGKELLEDCLEQALIKGDITLFPSTLDVKHTTKIHSGGVVEEIHEFRDKFCTGVEVIHHGVVTSRTGPYKINQDSGNVIPYLNNKFATQFPGVGVTYDYILYFIGENGSWNGFAQSAYKGGVYFPTHSKSTIAHELFHAMGLPHTFTNIEADTNAKFTYKATMTSNLMDYSHFISKPRFLTYHWQWKILNGNVPNA